MTREDRAKAMKDPLVLAVLSRFPGAKIVRVSPLATNQDKGNRMEDAGSTPAAHATKDRV